MDEYLSRILYFHLCSLRGDGIQGSQHFIFLDGVLEKQYREKQEEVIM
jgi:hypothetical protein